jgi:predicted nucleic acid-binding protein
MALAFLDTNVFLRHLRQDHPEFSPKATAYFALIEQRKVEVRTSDLVVFEAVYTLQRTYKQPKAAIRDALLPLLELPGIRLPGKRRYRRVFDRYVNLNLSFADAYHAVLMEDEKLGEVVSFDAEFDRVPGIKRVAL